MNQYLLFLQQQWTSAHSLFLYVFLFLVLFMFWFNKPHQYIKYNLPPSPWKLPIIGNLHQLHEPLHHSLNSLAKKHGPLILLHIGRVPTLVVSSAKMAQEVLKTNDLIFSSRPSTSISKRLLYGNTDIAFAPYDEYWRQVRKVCVLELLNAKKVQSFRVVREEEVACMVEEIKRISSSSISVNLSKIFALLSNNVICRVALGSKYGGEEGAGRFKDIIEEFGYLLGTFNVGDIIPSLAWVSKVSGLNARVEKNFHEMDSFLDEVIEEHIHKKKRIGGSGKKDEEDFVDVLLGIKEAKALGVPFSRDNVKALVLDMFGAGTETTSVTLEWAMSELLKHPEIMKGAQEEVRRISKGKLILTEHDDIGSMQYLKSVIKETLRMHPPIPLLLPRETIKETKIQGYDIPAKSTVIINAHTIGRDPKSWEEPEKFYPKRFMGGGDASLIDFKGQDFALIPFGAGRRGCPGIAFATTLVELALANLLNIFDWGLPDGLEGKDLDMDEGFGLSTNRKTNLVVTAMPHYS